MPVKMEIQLWIYQWQGENFQIIFDREESRHTQRQICRPDDTWDWKRECAAMPWSAPVSARAARSNARASRHRHNRPPSVIGGRSADLPRWEYRRRNRSHFAPDYATAPNPEVRHSPAGQYAPHLHKGPLKTIAVCGVPRGCIENAGKRVLPHFKNHNNPGNQEQCPPDAHKMQTAGVRVFFLVLPSTMLFY